MLAQLPALLPRRVLDRGQQAAGARQDRASLGVELLDLVEAAQVQHDAAEERHGLPVISRSGAARDDRHVFTDRRRNNTHDVFLRLCEGHGVGLQTFQLLRQHRGIFERVARQLPYHRAGSRRRRPRKHLDAGVARLGDTSGDGVGRRPRRGGEAARFGYRRTCVAPAPPSRSRGASGLRAPAPSRYRGDRLDLDQELRPREAGNDHQGRSRRRWDTSHRFVARFHVRWQMVAMRYKCVKRTTFFSFAPAARRISSTLPSARRAWSSADAGIEPSL